MCRPCEAPRTPCAGPVRPRAGPARSCAGPARPRAGPAQALRRPCAGLAQALRRPWRPETPRVPLRATLGAVRMSRWQRNSQANGRIRSAADFLPRQIFFSRSHQPSGDSRAKRRAASLSVWGARREAPRTRIAGCPAQFALAELGPARRQQFPFRAGRAALRGWPPSRICALTGRASEVLRALPRCFALGARAWSGEPRKACAGPGRACAGPHKACAGPARGLRGACAGPARGLPGPAQGLAGPARGLPRPAQGLRGAPQGLRKA